jgi:hypothetical protein
MSKSDTQSSAPAPCSPAIETARQKLVGAAVMYATAKDWHSAWDDPVTRPLMERATSDRLDDLQQAAREYFKAVCAPPKAPEDPNEDSPSPAHLALNERTASAWWRAGWDRETQKQIHIWAGCHWPWQRSKRRLHNLLCNARREAPANSVLSEPTRKGETS